MRPICWLHISDIHLTVRDAWSQDVVLRAMCEHIGSQRAAGTVPDFVLMSGDLAFSGKPQEYALAAGFFDSLSAASGIPSERIFCIPGNHDVDRGRQNACFHGARALLQSQNHVDSLLTGGDDLATLLQRQESFRRFQDSYFSGQAKEWTSDGLGYVSHLAFGDIRLAIVALNSAWLAEGDLVDHGKLLIGEHQVIEALRLALDAENKPHVVLGMTHHPVHLLNEFDRVPVRNRVESACHFIHCGHLHQPEAHVEGLNSTGCLTLTAGASFNTRQSHNTYSVVRLDLLHAVRAVTTVRYSPSTGTFSAELPSEYPVEVAPSAKCTVAELAEALGRHDRSLVPRAHYLSALLLDQKADLLIATNTVHGFGSFALLIETDSPLREPTIAFMAFKNVLRVLFGRAPLSEILTRYGGVVARYGLALEQICDGNAELRARLEQQELDVRILAATAPAHIVSHTVALLTELAEAGDWPALRDHALRHLDSPVPAVALQARRMLAFSLAHSQERTDRLEAIGLYRILLEQEAAEATDAGHLVTLLSDDGQTETAKTVWLEAVRRFPTNRCDYFRQIGHQIVATGGDMTFRNQMEAAIEQKRQRA
jgi:hypothetical protein